MSDGPRIRVAAVMRRGDDVLLVRHRKDGEEYHLLPGGGVERGESLAGALVREVREETGLSCVPGDPVLISDSIDPHGGRHVVQIAFEAEWTGRPTPSADSRVVGLDAVSAEELHSLDLRPPIHEALAEALRSAGSARARYLGPVWVDRSDQT